MGAEHWAWLGAGILSIAATIVLLGNAKDAVVKFWKSITAPNAEMRKDMDDFKEWRKELEEDGPMKEWRKSVDKQLSDTASTVNSVDGAYHVLFQTLLALLDHGIDGNNIKQMEEAKKAVQLYLIEK